MTESDMIFWLWPSSALMIMVGAGALWYHYLIGKREIAASKAGRTKAPQRRVVQ